MEKKQIYQEKIDAELERLDAQINLIQSKARKAKEDKRKELINQVQKLDEQWKEISLKLEDMRGKSQEAWQEMTEGLNRSLDELEASAQEALKKLG